MYAAKIDNGVIVEIIVGDAAWARDRLGGAWEPSDRKLGIGWTFTANEGFRPPKTYPSWVWDDGWHPPVPYPNDDAFYEWDEETLSWATVVPISGQE